jgi:hypothetical protein
MPEAELRLLVTSLTEGVCAQLAYAARNIQRDEARALLGASRDLSQALIVLDHAALTQSWRQALSRVAGDEQCHALLRGFSAHVLYAQGVLGLAETARHLSRALSRAVPPEQAGDWVDGFLDGAGGVLVHDVALLGGIDAWIAELSEADFTVLLPMLVRAFATLDRVERRHMLDGLKKARSTVGPAIVASAEQRASNAPGFAAALPLLLTILGLDATETRP